MPNPLIISVLLNTNRKNDTLECLAALYESSYDNHRVIVLDNGSTDGSVEAIRSSFPDAKLIRLKQNLGYAGNNNVGIQVAVEQGAEWVFLLNEDTVLAPDALAELIRSGENDAKIGVLGPMVYHYDEPNVIQSAGGMLGPHWLSIHLGKNEIDRGQYSAPHPVEWVSGCGIMVRRAAIQEAGALDERYFYYWEETEWCLRIRKCGWRIMQVPCAKMWHKGVQRDYHPQPSITYYATRNRLFTLKKHRAPFKVWIFAWGQFIRTLGSWTLMPKWRSKYEHRNAMARGLIDFLLQRWGPMTQ